jgi:hypothetical protein
MTNENPAQSGMPFSGNRLSASDCHHRRPGKADQSRRKSPARACASLIVRYAQDTAAYDAAGRARVFRACRIIHLSHDRENIFNPSLRVIGIACGDHPMYQQMCVMTLAAAYEESSVEGGRKPPR